MAKTPKERLAALQAENAALKKKIQAMEKRGDGWSLPFAELPADYAGHLPRRVEVSLVPRLRRKVQAIRAGLREANETIPHPRDPDARKPVYEAAHTLQWLLEKVELTG